MTAEMGAIDKPECCEACQFETGALTRYDKYRNFPEKEEFKWLCEICASTMAGTAYEYPDQYPNREVMFMMAWCTNRILAAIDD